MKVLVTGATGFIGRAVAAALAARGDRLVVLARQPGSTPLPPGTERVQWDAAAPPPRSAFDGVDAVLHLAGETIAQRWTPERKQRIRRSRVDGTRHVVDAILGLDTPPRALVSASAVGIYGDRGDEILSEASAPGAGFLADVCRDWEAEAARAAGERTRVVQLRTGVVLDAGGGALAPLLPLFKLGLGGRIASGRQWMSWVHRDDAVGLVLHALDRDDLRGPIDVTAPEPARNADFTRALAAALHRPAFFPVPASVLRVALGEAAEMLVGGQRVIPERALATGFRFRHPTLAAALRAIVER